MSMTVVFADVFRWTRMSVQISKLADECEKHLRNKFPGSPCPRRKSRLASAMQHSSIAEAAAALTDPHGRRSFRCVTEVTVYHKLVRKFWVSGRGS